MAGEEFWSFLLGTWYRIAAAILAEGENVYQVVKSLPGTTWYSDAIRAPNGLATPLFKHL